MKDYEVIGWVFDGEHYCPEHKPSKESEPIFACNETDPLTSCVECVSQWERENPLIPLTPDWAPIYLDQDAAEAEWSRRNLEANGPCNDDDIGPPGSGGIDDNFPPGC